MTGEDLASTSRMRIATGKNTAHADFTSRTLRPGSEQKKSSSRPRDFNKPHKE